MVVYSCASLGRIEALFRDSLCILFVVNGTSVARDLLQLQPVSLLNKHWIHDLLIGGIPKRLAKMLKFLNLTFFSGGDLAEGWSLIKGSTQSSLGTCRALLTGKTNISNHLIWLDLFFYRGLGKCSIKFGQTLYNISTLFFAKPLVAPQLGYPSHLKGGG